MEQLLVGGFGNGLHHQIGKLGLEKAELVLKVMATVAWIRGLEVKMADLKQIYS